MHSYRYAITAFSSPYQSVEHMTIMGAVGVLVGITVLTKELNVVEVGKNPVEAVGKIIVGVEKKRVEVEVTGKKELEGNAVEGKLKVSIKQKMS